VEAGLYADHGVVEQAAAIAGPLGPACREQVAWWHAIRDRKPCMWVAGALGRAGIDQDHRARGSEQHQCRTQPGSAATDYQDVVFLLALTPQATSTTTLALARPCSR
jgi:hypothetical protein